MQEERIEGETLSKLGGFRERKYGTKHLGSAEIQENVGKKKVRGCGLKHKQKDNRCKEIQRGAKTHRR